jgi:uncharacterized membrane protein
MESWKLGETIWERRPNFEKKRLVFVLEKTFLLVSGIVSLVTLSLSLCNKHDVSFIVGRFWSMSNFLDLLHLIIPL